MYAIMTETEMLGWFVNPVSALKWLLEHGSVEIMEADEWEADSRYIRLSVRWEQREIVISYWSCPAEAEAHPPKPFRKVK